MSDRRPGDDAPSTARDPASTHELDTQWGRLPDAPTELDTSIIKLGGSRRRRWLLGLTSAVLVAGGVWALGSTDSDRNSGNEPTPLFQGAGSAATETRTETAGRDPRARAAEPEIIIVLSPLRTGTPVRLQRTPSRRQPWWAEERLPTLSGFTVDSSGRWLAATDGNRLLIGAVDGRLEQVASRVSSFVWHDTQPGQLAAVIDGDQLQLFHATPTPSRRPTWPEVDGGRLIGWGDWGVLLGGPGGDGYVLWPAGGARIAGGQEPVGMLPGGRLARLADDGVEVLNQDADGALDPEWLGDDTRITGIVLGGNGPRTALQLRDGADDPGHVVVVGADLEVLEVIPESDHIAAMVWTDFGSRLLLIRERPDEGVALIRFDPGDGSTEEWPLPGLDPGSHTAVAIANVPGSG